MTQTVVHFVVLKLMSTFLAHSQTQTHIIMEAKKQRYYETYYRKYGHRLPQDIAERKERAKRMLRRKRRKEKQKALKEASTKTNTEKKTPEKQNTMVGTKNTNNPTVDSPEGIDWFKMKNKKLSTKHWLFATRKGYLRPANEKSFVDITTHFREIIEKPNCSRINLAALSRKFTNHYINQTKRTIDTTNMIFKEKDKTRRRKLTKQQLLQTVLEQDEEIKKLKNEIARMKKLVSKNSSAVA